MLIARDCEKPQSPSIPVVSSNRELNTLVSYSSQLMLMAEAATDMLCSIKVSTGSNSPEPHTACNTATGASVGVNDHGIISHTSFLPEYFAASGRRLGLIV